MAKHYLYNTTFKKIKSSDSNNKNPENTQLANGILNKAKSIEEIVQEGIDNGDIVAGTSFNTAPGLKLDSGTLKLDFDALALNNSPDLSMDKVAFYSVGDDDYYKVSLSQIAGSTDVLYSYGSGTAFTLDHDLGNIHVISPTADSTISFANNFPIGARFSIVIVHP